MTPRCALTGSLPSSFTTAFRNLSVTSRRNFSSTQFVEKTAKENPQVPPYPYGPRLFFKQADSGLYGGSSIQFGNKISKGRNEGKTRRFWKPNIRVEQLWSEALQEELTIKVQHRVVRTIRKVGGLDQYLLGDKPGRIKELGLFGWNLRWRVMMSMSMRERFEAERTELGVRAPETFKEYLDRHTNQQKVQAVLDDQAKAAELRELKKAAPLPKRILKKPKVAVEEIYE